MKSENSPLLANHEESNMDSSLYFMTRTDSNLTGNSTDPSGVNKFKCNFNHDLERLEFRKDFKEKPFATIDVNAAMFALRMATCLTVSALFVLIRTDEWHYPDGMWVLVSVLFVSWFPSLDAASVIEKITQRLVGTFVGAFLGLGCGFLSLVLFCTRTCQAYFLGVCMFVCTFGVIFFAGQVRCFR